MFLKKIIGFGIALRWSDTPQFKEVSETVSNYLYKTFTQDIKL